MSISWQLNSGHAFGCGVQQQGRPQLVHEIVCICGTVWRLQLLRSASEAALPCGIIVAEQRSGQVWAADDTLEVVLVLRKLHISSAVRYSLGTTMSS
jgi:hypothetical protein